MQDEGNGNEQSGWKPPEYVSPWASTPAEDGGEGNQDTVAFGSGERDEPGEPTRSFPQPEQQQGGFAGYGRPWGQPQSGDAGQQGQPDPAQGGYQGQGGYLGQGGAGYGAPGQGGAGYGAPGQGGAGYGGPGYGVPGYGGAGYGGQGFGTPDMPEYYPGRRGGGLGRFLIYAAVAVLAAGAGAGAAVALSHSANTSSGISSQDVPAPPNAQAGGNNNASGNSGAGTGSLNQQALETKVDPAIVDVTSTLKYQNETAEGTGIILSPDGVVLTNNHVIDGATSIRATLATSGKTFTATVIGYDTTDDVALLKLSNASGLSKVTVGNSGSVKLNDPVLALGNAQGRMGTPSAAAGIVNALHRTINASDSGSSLTETLHDMIQTNAQIQEGDSGGPLVNASGQVIGMNTAANTTGDQFGQSTATTGFAIPINKALSIAKTIADGKATNTVHIGLAGFMGVGVADISNADRCLQSNQGLGGGVGNYTPPASSGAVVCSAYAGTPAASSGLVAGDVITSVNGHAISNEAGLTKITNTTHPNDKITVTYVDANHAKHTTTFSLLEIAK